MMNRVLYHLASSVLLFALYAGLVGALFDHHYAERQPWHDHIWSGAMGEHQHTGADPEHMHTVPMDGSAGPVTAIVSNNASAAYWALLSLGVVMALHLPRVLAPPFVMGRRARAMAVPDGACVPPPDRPPA